MGKHVELGGMAGGSALPEWVPVAARHYIAHTEKGAPIRVLARAAGCHASTVMRQIRKLEMRRDDPLVDGVLRKLGKVSSSAAARAATGPEPDAAAARLPDDATLTREAMRVLRRLCESGAVLAVAADLKKAVVVRDTPSGANTRTAVVDTAVAQAMALKDWIAPANTGRIVRYTLTGTGRTALEGFLTTHGAIPETGAGMAESAARFEHALPDDLMGEDDGTVGRSRFAVGESPLAALARRRDKAGNRFLSDALVSAGEQLREDFELAQMAGGLPANWAMDPGAVGSAADPELSGPSARARDRVRAALDHLGPGLCDVVLRCCCYLEGLETTEKRLGWSARSGKVVLRIALMRLRRHYDETVGPGGPLIG